jgi:chemotaxis protein MotB
MRLQQRIRRDQARHTDDWLITYADTITLLLCLFVITLTMKTGVKPPMSEAAAPVNQTTSQEGVFWGLPAIRSFSPISEAASDAIAPAPIRPAAATEPQVTEDTERFAYTPPVATPAQAAPEPARASLPAVVARLSSQGTPIVAQSGDRITTLQIGSAAFFGSGSAALSNAGKAILSDVAATLQSREFAAYHITIEGHTDDTPISTPQFQSNWELSAARAAAVVRFLLDLGVPAGKLTASGYADTVPIAPNRTADGAVIPDNQARNRRVVIRLEKIDKAKQ